MQNIQNFFSKGNKNQINPGANPKSNLVIDESIKIAEKNKLINSNNLSPIHIDKTLKSPIYQSGQNNAQPYKNSFNNYDTRSESQAVFTRQSTVENGAVDKSEDDILDDEISQRIFKTKEIVFKQNDQFRDNKNFLNTDLLMKGDFETQFKDRDGRIILHRAALEQRADVIRQTFENLQHKDENYIKSKIDQKDNYGNTALLLCPINDKPEKRKTRGEIMRTLLSKGAYPDVQNPNSLFTPLHWACVNGATDIVQELLQRNAKVYIPDKFGFFPIDYAGYFKHVDCVKALIDHTLYEVSKYRQANMVSEQWDQLLDKYIDRYGKNGRFAMNHDNIILLFNPVLHTSILYWASMYNEIDNLKIEEILIKLESYPEGPVMMDKWKTPCHAAAQSGVIDKLKTLLKNIHDRYQKGLKPNTVRVYRKDFIPNYKERWISMLKQKRYYPIRKFYNVGFERKLWEYSQMKNFVFDFQDKFLNTPLHTASQYGNELCVQMLIEEYHLSLGLRNSQGWMPKDLQQHDKVCLTYQQYYKKKDTLLRRKAPLKPTLRPQDEENSQTQKDNGPPDLNLEPTQSMIQKDQEEELDHALISEKDKLDKELIKCREYMAQVPPFVLKVNKTKENKNIINNMIIVLQNQGFTVQMFPSLNPELYYIALKLKQSRLESEAKNMKLKVKLCDIDAKQEFEPNQKIKFEPFRTKDQQKIIMSLVKTILNTDSLLQQKIIVQILPMHDFYGIHEIKDKWENNSRFWLQPIFIIRQFYNEGIKLEFIELSAIKNYFGEKTGFYFAWMSFYTTWILIPSILGLILTIYQIMSKVDVIWTSIYSLVVCIWVTIFIERWRRKSSEIALRWGVLDQKSDKVKEVRPEFNGDEYFSNVNHQVNKLNVQARFYLFIFLSVPIFIVLIGACVGVYFATREYKNANLNDDINHDRIIQISAGVINGFVISVVNFVYQQLAIYFMRLENHKYDETYEKSFIFKLFAFKFINTNISLFYTAFIDKNFISLYYLIVGMALQKSLQIFVFKILKKYLTFYYFRRQYFKKVKACAIEQQKKHQNFLNELNADQQERIQQKIQEVKDKALFTKVYQNHLSAQEVYHRLVFNTTGKLGDSQIFLDYIEINSLMSETFEKDQINEISEVFILFGLATLYACACPIVAFIVMIHNLFDIKFDLWTQYTCIRRPIMQVKQNIGPWLAIAEFMAIVAVISNCLLLYFSSPTLKAWLSDTFELQSEIYLLWIIVCIEHFIITVKVLCSMTINDMPSWVRKSYARVMHQQEVLMLEENERDENEKIKILETKILEYQARYKKILSDMKQKAIAKNQEILMKNAKLSEFDKERALIQSAQKEQDKLKGVQIMKEIEQQKAGAKKGEDLKLIDFLDIKETEWLGKQKAFELEKALSRNFQKRLMTQTFNTLEREILGRRISRLYDTKKINQINCAQCSQKVAIIECLNCQDHFCKTCSDDIHAPSKQVFAMHSLMNVPLEPQQKFDLLKPQIDLYSQKIQSSTSNQSIWKKFEYFNFPLDPGNDQYTYIQKQYIYLRQQYIDANFIEPQDKIGYQGLFVDKQYDLLTDSQAKILQNRHKKMFGDQVIEAQTTRFNEEELFYMNRVAFYLFRHKGENLTFANYCTRLNILQYSPYNRRVTLWLSIIDEKGDETITKTLFETILNTIFVQDLTQQLKVDSIVEMIFGKETQELTINKLIEIVNKEGPVKQFMECVIQFNPKEIKDI